MIHHVYKLIKKYIQVFFITTRWQEWYGSRPPFVFLTLFYFHISTRFLGDGYLFYRNFSLLFLASLCYFSFLFLVNEYFDLEQDIKSGKAKISKKNKNSLHIPTMIGLLVLGVFLPTLTWNVITPRSVTCVVLVFFLAFFYSSPPLRFKEQNFLGIIIASFVLRPAGMLLALSGFNFYSSFPAFLAIFTWVMILGMRQMLRHQINDFAFDLRGGVNTFAVNAGVKKTHKIRSSLLPAEITLFFLILLITAKEVPSLIVTVLIYGFIYILMARKTGNMNVYFGDRPPFFHLLYVFIPIHLSLFIAQRDSLWLLPVFILYWQRQAALDFVHQTMSILNAKHS